MILYDAYKDVKELGGPMPPPATIAATAFATILNLAGYSHSLGLGTGVDQIRKIQAESKEVATELAKFNYIMNSENRYLMLGFPGRKAFLGEFDLLKEQIQQRDFIKYDSTSENTVYKEVLLEQVNNIYDMNRNFKESNDILKRKLEEIEKAVKQIDAETINKQIYTPVIPINY